MSRHKRKPFQRKGPIVDLFNEQCGLCCYCSGKMTLKLGRHNTATVEHILPRSHGGKDHFNRSAACLDCNQERGNTPLLIYLAERLERGASTLAPAAFLTRHPQSSTSLYTPS